MFDYLGSKMTLAPLYPGPPGDTVIECFAGSASYPLYYGVRRAILYDLDPIICAIWRYLIRVSAAEIRALPLFELGDNLNKHRYLPIEARYLLGHINNRGSTMMQAVTGSSTWTAARRERIARQVELIRDWEIHEMSYENAAVIPGAVTFVDPPYKVAGLKYRCKFYDYAGLADWVRMRTGLVIVCEGPHHGNWLPFRPLAEVHNANNRMTAEYVYIQNRPAVTAESHARLRRILIGA
jgi:site-specific DNA-adenine methylase